MNISPKDIPGMLAVLRQGTEHLTAMAKSMESPWDPTSNDPRRLHNMFARSLISCYASKFAELSSGILHGFEHSQFLIYALCGRALIETTATLRYYVLHEYKPLLEKSPPDPEAFIRLIEIDDRHLRGTRFDWDSFFFHRYAKLKEDAITNLRDKNKKTKSPTNPGAITAQQVNVLTCIEKWANVTPEALVAYNLFCDLVHPNIGSTFLVTSRVHDRFYFSRFLGEPLGRDIFEQSFPMLMSLTHKPFADHLLTLMGTITPDDEL